MSSFADKIKNATSQKSKDLEPASPTRKYSAASSSSPTKGPSSSASSKYSSPAKRVPHTDVSATNSRSTLPPVVSPTRRIPPDASSSSKSVPDESRASSKPRLSESKDRRSLSRKHGLTGIISSGGGRRKSAGEVAFVTRPPYAILADTRLEGSPYGKALAYEKTPKRSSFSASLLNLSNSLRTPENSPSPQVSTIGSSPNFDFGDVPGSSSSLLVDSDLDEISGVHPSPPRLRSDAGKPVDDGLSRSGRPQEEEQQQSGGIGRHKSVAEHPPVSNIPDTSVNVGGAFTGVLPSGVALMTNPLYPTISSPDASPSPPPSAPHIDGFNIPAVGINLPNAASDISPLSWLERSSSPETAAEFLQKRKAAAATQRQKVPSSGDPNSAASQAILKRRTQVLSTVQKAKTRLSLLTYEVTRKRRSFRNNWFGRFRRWIYERERKRIMGKGTVYLRLWVESLKAMEVSYGSTLMLAFSFIRWVFLLNAILAVMWVCVIIIPFMAHPPATFSWKLFWHNLGDKKALKDTIQGSNLEKTFVYYGGYTYTRAEQPGKYRVDYMYGVMIGATFLISFIGVLGRIAGRIMSSGDIAMAARLYPFSSLVFASWDFHLTSLEAASKLRRGIRMQLKEMLADAGVKEKTNSLRDRLMSAKRATALLVLWPLVLAGTVAAVVNLVTKAEQVNLKFGSNYAQAVLLSMLNIITPMFIRVLVDMEDWKPATAERVVLLKLFFLRVVNLGALFYRMFIMLEHTLQVRENQVAVESCLGDEKCDEGFICCKQTNVTQWNICTERDLDFCLPACTENAVGTQLLRLIFMTTLINNAYELIYGFGYVWATSGNKRQLYIEDMAIDIVYVQALVWVGSCFSPMASVMGFFSNLVTWYGMRIALFRTCAPVEKAHSASRTSTLTYGLLLLTLILSTIPATLNVMQRSSGFCGPIRERVSMYTVISSYVQKAPSGLWLTLQWLTNPAVLLGVILLLIFGVVLLQSKLVQSRQFLSLTKHEMGMQRREASEKITRVRQTLLQERESGSGSGAAMELPASPHRGSRSNSAPPGQVEAVKVPTETSYRRENNESIAAARKESIGSMRRASLDTKIDYPKIN